MSNENKTAVKEFVQRYINSHEPDTFARNENGLMMYQLKHSGINLESFFEDIIEDFISEQNELASLQTQSIVEDKEIHIEALQDQVPEMCNENKTALTAEEQAKEYLDTIQVSGEYYQSKIGNSIIHLQNIMTDFAEEFASLQTQEKDKEIERLKKYCASEGALNSVQRMKLDKVERDKIKFSEEQNIKLHEENEELIVLIESQQKEIEELDKIKILYSTLVESYQEQSERIKDLEEFISVQVVNYTTSKLKAFEVKKLAISLLTPTKE